MSLFSWFEPTDTGSSSTTSGTRPINGSAVGTTVANTESSGGSFGWLDNLGGAVGTVLGKAADVAAQGWYQDIAQKFGPEQTYDQQPQFSPSVLNNPPSFFQENKDLVLGAGLFIVGITTVVVLYKVLK